MADDRSRPYRPYEPYDRQHGEQGHSANGDPLAELARLIGQETILLRITDMSPRARRPAPMPRRDEPDPYRAPPDPYRTRSMPIRRSSLRAIPIDIPRERSRTANRATTSRLTANRLTAIRGSTTRNIPTRIMAGRAASGKATMRPTHRRLRSAVGAALQCAILRCRPVPRSALSGAAAIFRSPRSRTAISRSSWLATSGSSRPATL